MQLLRRLAASRIVRLLVVAGGSWRFWAASALAATAVTVVAYVYTRADGSAADVGKYVYYDLVGPKTGSSSNSNATDRVLLMNADSNAKCYVDCDNLTGATTGTKTNRNWWEFLNTNKVTLTSTYGNMLPGTHFKLHAKGADGKTLWEMVNCRGGNLNKVSHEYINRLPFVKGTAKQYKLRNVTATAATAGTLIMLNTDEAQVLSSCYEEGIGTVYLDAVNAYKGYTSGQLVIEVAYGVFKTNVLGRVDSEHMKIPDDLEVASTNANGEVVYVRPVGEVCDEFSDDGFGTITTNSLGRVAWQRVNMEGSYFTASTNEPIAKTDVLKLQCAVGNSDKNFYRVWAAVQDRDMNPDLAEHCRRPMRLRIRRLDNPEDYIGYAPGLDGGSLPSQVADQNGLLILDNIIASLPAMTVSAQPKGEYVKGGSSRNEIGWRGSVSKLYPAFGDDDLHGVAALVAVTNTPPDSDVTDAWLGETKAAMMYRWRYVGQTNDWKSVGLAMADGVLAAADPLVLPHEPGDVEYYYVTTNDAPYYGYVDYTGGDYGTPGYSERVKTVETRLSPEFEPLATEGLPSSGTNFFFRLREGQSDQLEYRLQLRDVKTHEEHEIPFYLTGDGVWKTFVHVTTNLNEEVENGETGYRVGDYDFRVAGMDPAVYYGGVATKDPLPWSGKPLTEDTTRGGSNAWTRVALDATTGAILFQVTEASGGSLTYTVVHADFQDFNSWTDAVSSNLYVGAYTKEKGRQSGSSPDTRTFASELNDWTATAASNLVHWTENFEISHLFAPEDGWDDNPAYESFAESATPNGWRAYNGQWVCGKYRESAMGGDLALSLDRAGKGLLEYVNMEVLPQGVDEFSLKGRVSQAASFDQFMYYANAGVEDMTNYLFSTRVVMGTPNDTFDGNGSVSLVGYYNPGAGCYEIRAERIADDLVKLSLYKWTLDVESDQVEPLLLADHVCMPAKDKNTGVYQIGNGGLSYKTFPSNANTYPTYLQCNDDLSNVSSQSAAKYGAMFIRCTSRGSGASRYTVVEAGLLADRDGSSGANMTGGTEPSGKRHTYFQYVDHEDPFSYGYFGYTSLNCPARFFNAKWHKGETGAVFPPLDPTKQSSKLSGGKVQWNTTQTTEKSATGGLCKTNPLCATSIPITYPTTVDDNVFEQAGSRYRNWTSRPNRFKVWNGSSTYQICYKNAALAVEPTSTIELYLDETTSTGTVTRLVGAHTFSNFVYETTSFTIRSTAQARPRLKTAVKSSSDIVVDAAKFSQWSAADYSDSDNYWFLETAQRQGLGSPEHYVYLNGWVTAGTFGSTVANTVTLAPARVRPGELSIIRSPLMDGLNDGYGRRGLGLGVFSYTYRNADPKCRVFVQYREMYGASGVRRATSGEDGWTTVATNDFSKMSAAERAGGTISTYFGLHGTQGMMRILVDPDVVTAAQDEKTNKGKDPSYGAITITSFLCRDAPPLDDRCWMGWNMRTTDVDDERSLYDGRGSDAGLAFGLNNSATKDVEETYTDDDGHVVEYGDLFKQNLPFVQTPTFVATNLVGEVGFRARRLPGATNATEVAVFGAKTADAEEADAWHLLRVFLVTNDTYRAYTYRAGEGDDYAAFRLAVIGVAEVSPNYSSEMMVRPAQRVLIDDVYVSEAIRGRIAFRNVAAFRNGLDDTDPIAPVANVMDRSQQPLTQDSWGVQCEVYVAQMEEEIDTSRAPEVYLHWYVGEEPWGYANWRDSKDAHVAKLEQVSDSKEWVFRSSYAKCPEAVIEPISTNCVVQYSLEARYWAAGSDETTKPLTNILSSTDWTTPSWYHPLDLNAGKSFSAYTILDSISPGWAWVNEVNVFGTYDDVFNNSDVDRQYVEVAMPADADLENWELRLLGVDSLYEGKVVTNVVARFGHSVGGNGKIPGTKSANMASNCVFLVVANDSARSAKTLDAAKGEVDGYWLFDNESSLFQERGVIAEDKVLAVQLVRASGIIEHELLTIGTNYWEGTLFDDFKPDEYLDFFNGVVESNGQFFMAGREHGGEENSLGSLQSSEASSNVWSFAMKRTPGRINEGQYINPEHPVPAGDSVHVYFNVSDHLWQTINGEKTNAAKMVVVRKGDANGLDVTYDVERWYVFSGVTTNGVAAAPTQENAHRYKLTVAKACSNSMVTVSAAVRENDELLEKAGLAKDDWYREAVLDWLRNGTDLYGNKWADGDSEDIQLAEYQSLDGKCSTNLTLTSMYWLDIPPTEGGWVLRGGTKMTAPAVVYDSQGKTNVRVSVFMMISNKNEVAEWATSAPHRLAHPPYALRGGLPGENSLGLDPTVAGTPAWTSVTFKVTGFLQNDLNRWSNRESHVPLRWFVFNEDSFYPRGDPNEFWTTIDVRHPFTKESPAQNTGYKEWADAHGTDWPVFYGWDLDDRLRPVTVEPLKADSTIE